MRTISAVDAVSLAIQRTREFLFTQFTWGTYLKLGLVAILTEGLGSNFRSSTRRLTSHGYTAPRFTPFPFHPDSQFNFKPEVLMAIGAVVLAVIILTIAIAYLITRLRFAYFHCLTCNTRLIGPGWYLYRGQAMRFFLLTLAVGFGFLLLMALIAIPFVHGFFLLYQEITQTGKPDIGMVLSLVLPLIPIIFLLALAGLLANLILRDWMLPHFALEDATTGEAWASAWARISTEKREFFVYALLRVALPIVAGIGLFILLLIPGLVLAGSLAAVEFAIHSVFTGSTGTPAIVGILLQAFFAVLAFVFAVLACICLGGPLATGIREYALIFYGGRYKVLGDILYPTPPPAIAGGPSEVV